MATISSSPSHLTAPSSGTVSLHIINTTSSIGIPLNAFVSPTYHGHETTNLPSYSFLISHPSGRTLLYDIGVRKHWEDSQPDLVKRLKSAGITAHVERDVRTILDESNYDWKQIEALVWSHGHFDHTGDPSRFPSIPLLVGPGFKAHKGFMPGWPAGQDSPFLESDFADREVREVSFGKLKVGQFDAVDYFSDGSFYLLDAPGHFQGQICGLARLGSGCDETWVFMGADAAHHGGEFRPSGYMPLPKQVPEGLKVGDLKMDDFAGLLGGDRSRTFYAPSSGQDVSVAEETIRKIQELDALGNVLVVLAHDGTLEGVLDFYPEKVQAEKVKSWKGATWDFLSDLVEAARRKRDGQEWELKK